MILATNLCFLWLLINVFIFIPKKMTREEILFIFLTSSLLLMTIIIPMANDRYLDIRQKPFSLQEFFPFFLNRNMIYPLSTLLILNISQLLIRFRSRIIWYAVSVAGFTVYTLMEKEHTVIRDVPVVILVLFFSAYLLLLYFLLKSFRVLSDSETGAHTNTGKKSVK
jgi:hypothetical protein